MAEKSHELEDTSIDIIQSDVLRAKKTEGKQSLSQRPRGSMKHTNTHGMGEPRGAKKDAGEVFGNNNGHNVQNLMENVESHIQEAQQTPSWKHTKIFTHRHIIVKLLKEEEKAKVLKSSKRKMTLYVQRRNNMNG